MSRNERELTEWARKVGEVFTTRPRDGSTETRFWLTRSDEEKAVRYLLNLEGVSLCIDGPTGTGKSSLAITELSKSSLPYASIQVGPFMDWAGLCSQFFDTPPVKGNLSAKLSAGLTSGLPSAGVELGADRGASASFASKHSQVTGWQENDLCQILQRLNFVLVIDDFEHATNELVVRTARMCKLASQTFANDKFKIVIVGTGDIFRRLRDADPSLESRLREISIGTLRNPFESWKMLQLGFERLGLEHPGNDRFMKYRQGLDDCRKAVFQAANGLPKSLIELGTDIALAGIGRRRVTPTDIIDAAENKPKRDLYAFRRRIPVIARLVEESAAIRLVLHELYRTGVGQIHIWDDLNLSLRGALPREQIDSAIAQLVQEKFLVQTGENGEVLYVDNPRLAHLLGIVVNDPERYGETPEKYSPFGQLDLPFLQRPTD